jgi:hypothetical protein
MRNGRKTEHFESDAAKSTAADIMNKIKPKNMSVINGDLGRTEITEIVFFNGKKHKHIQSLV